MEPTEVNQQLYDILSNVLTLYEDLRPTIMKCINEDILRPGVGEQVLRDYRELRSTLENWEVKGD